MADLRALMSSRNAHYCTPPKIAVPVRQVLVPKGSRSRVDPSRPRRTLLDPSTNAAALGSKLLRPTFIADGITVDGLSLAWNCADTWFNNPPYGIVIKDWIERQCYWGREAGVPGISLVPARTDPAWAQRIFASADAWLFVDGRLTFWVPIPLELEDATPPRQRRDKDGKLVDDGPYYLRRWFPDASDEHLPPPFRLLEPGLAIGPELGRTGAPQAAPFPSLVPFWGDPNAAERDPRDELAGLRELVRTAAAKLEVEPDDDASRWLAQAEALLGSQRFRSRAPLDLAPFDRLAAATKLEPDDSHPIDVRAFARRFGRLGTLIVNRGPHAGAYRIAA